jgi:hypothetical protein
MHWILSVLAVVGVTWGLAHPAAGIALGAALVLGAVALVRACRELAPVPRYASWSRFEVPDGTYA